MPSATQVNLIDMGMGELGGNDIVFKRKYRWTLGIQCHCSNANIPTYFVKLASRPNLTVEEQEINFLNSKMWIPGKASWETITVTFYDLAGQASASGISALYSWIATVYNFTSNGAVRFSQASKKGAVGGTQGYAATANLNLYDGCGTNLENWQLGHVWPQAVNFGELDYTSSEEVTIEATLRYSDVQYTPLCGGLVAPCCTGCND